MLYVEKYQPDNKKLWDEYILSSKNGHFMFCRDYMEYHSDRFEDLSLIFFDEKKRITALLPANLSGDVCYSHQGLTFGGLIISDKTSTQDVMDVFQSLIIYLKNNQVIKFIYKGIPFFYSALSSQEDLYALHLNGARIKRRDVASVINLDLVPRYSKGRKWSVNKSKKEKIKIIESSDYVLFWDLLNNTLRNNHDARPVHSIDEIILLKDRFPENIKLYVAKKNEEIIAGTIIFENNGVAHTQYIANSDKGREIGAIDGVIDHLIQNKYQSFRFFSFGISTENNGEVLNAGLIAQKEGFGARAVVHDFYELNIK